jgi:VIT1/CCC1 family predicted Fe2+/Mn2+ transporter
MTPRRRRRPKAKSESQELPPTTDDLESLDESNTPFSTLADPDATTWQESPDQGITAPVKLPSQEAMTVQLGPVNYIERLDEYHSDENLAYALIGLLVGAILGIIADGFVQIPVQFSSLSIILIIILVIFSGFSLLWLIRIRNRRKSVQKQIIEN